MDTSVDAIIKELEGNLEELRNHRKRKRIKDEEEEEKAAPSQRRRDEGGFRRISRKITALMKKKNFSDNMADAFPDVLAPESSCTEIKGGKEYEFFVPHPCHVSDDMLRAIDQMERVSWVTLEPAKRGLKMTIVRAETEEACDALHRTLASHDLVTNMDAFQVDSSNETAGECVETHFNRIAIRSAAVAIRNNFDVDRENVLQPAPGKTGFTLSIPATVNSGVNYEQMKRVKANTFIKQLELTSREIRGEWKIVLIAQVSVVQ